MTDRPRPLILIRGFGGPDVQDEQRDAYQGFNDGTVYPGRRGENYLYEGFVLRCLKSGLYPYRDATNVVGYYKQDMPAPDDVPEWLVGLVSGTVVVDAALAEDVFALRRGASGTLWIYRYYDLLPRTLECFGKGLVRLIEIIKRGTEHAEEEFAGVDIVAHSMGGLVVRSALKELGKSGKMSGELIHRIVTLGTPHRGIAFEYLPAELVKRLPLAAGDEIAAFDPNHSNAEDVGFPHQRILTVVGTDYGTYGNKFASLGNRLSTLLSEGILAYNRSDGLVKQASAQLPGAPRTFVHKCHGGRDSLVTSREAYEIAMRFFHGSHHVRLHLTNAKVKRGHDIFGRSEFYFGVSIKPRFVDFDLFHQSSEAENCYGPFHKDDFTDPLPNLATELRQPLAQSGDATSGWAGPDRLIWEGWVDASVKPAGARSDATLVFRLDFYVGERDTFGVGFSDNVVFRKQYYVQYVPTPAGPSLYRHTGERYLNPDVTPEQFAAAAADQSSGVQRMTPDDEAQPTKWMFSVGDPGFEADLTISLTADS
jgi:pimeloyl-ACP methyl ester carboxylesterase